MRRWTWIAPALALLWPAAAHAAAPPLLSLFHGEAAKTAGLTLGGWGSGTAVEAPEEALYGSRSIFVTTGGYYSGGRIDFASPVDMSRFADAKGAALRITIKAPGAAAPSADDSGIIPGGGERIAQGPPIPGGPPMPGGYYPGTPGTPDAGPTLPLSTKLRVVLYSGGNEIAALDQPVDPDTQENGWVSAIIPLAAFHGPNNKPADWSGFKVSRLLLFGNVRDAFYVGDISVIQANRAITGVSAGENQEIYAGDTAYFDGTANGGAALKYSWDFDASDGIQEDAIGQHVYYIYRKAGDFTVTLTVSDPTGILPSVTSSSKVAVNE